MAKKLNFLILLVSISISTFCQDNYPKVVVLGPDTVVIFSKEQVKSLAITKLEMNMYKEMSDSCYSNAEIMKRKIEVQDQIISNFGKQLALSDSIISQHKNIEKMLSQDLLIKDDEIKRLRKQSWLLSAIAIITTGILIWK
jgi:hypothetical protein